MTDSPIDAYLDQLFLEVRASAARDARSLLSEAEAHLRDAADEAERTGLPRIDAERMAVARFGEPDRIAHIDRDRTAGRVVARVALSGWILGCIGAVAVGASGLVAGIMRMFGTSTAFIAGTRTTAHLGAADCARWLAGSPHAHSCAQAALDDWTWEVIAYRIGVGLLGAVGFVALSIGRRRSLRIRTWPRLPDAIVDTIATTIFGIAAVWLTALGIDSWIARGGHGAGFWLSAAPVALAGGVVFGRRLVHDVQTAD